MGLKEQIWKDKEKGEVNPLAFSEVAQNWAQKIDIEGRNLLTKEEQSQLERKFKNKKEREKFINKIQKERIDEFSKLKYDEWLKIQNKYNKKNSNNYSQIRKFYDTVFNLNQRAKALDMQSVNPPEKTKYWNAILAQLHRQLALVHNAKGRNLVTKSFVDMMEELVMAISQKEEQGKKDLEIITNFLEAFMAYYRECRPKD